MKKMCQTSFKLNIIFIQNSYKKWRKQHLIEREGFEYNEYALCKT